jgi:NADPH:quinone reductase-like Zn-dependent oxidoreductase
MLIKVFAAGINPVDTYIRAGKRTKMSGEVFPMVIGRDLAGEVAGVGSAVKNFKTGDRVMSTVAPKTGGSYAEFAVVDESRACLLPQKLSFNDAAGIPVAAVTALQSFEKAGAPLKNRNILIIGASGGVGTFAVQIAKEMGAKVNAVCSSRNSPLVKSLGADEVFEYDKTDYMHSGRKFDFVFDYAGGSKLVELKMFLGPKGKYITTVRRTDMFMGGFFDHKYKWFLADINAKYLNMIRDKIDSGAVRVVVDRIFPMALVVEAHRYVETKRAVGKVILQIR